MVSMIEQRATQDRIVNDGRKLINLCLATHTVIVNGRVKSDPLGSLTCYTNNGSSLVDYVICSSDLIDCIDLKVDDINCLSDHCIIHTYVTLPHMA